MSPNNEVATTTSQTFWEQLVWITFNPSNDDLVYQIKLKYSQIIDMLNNQRASWSQHSEYQRYISIAITEAQTAQMWAVKAVTAK